MKIRQAGCLVAATAALLLTGCAGNNTSSSEESSAETSVSAATTVDPQAIQKVNQLFATSTTIENAKQAALKQCMQGKGFTYTPSNVQPAQYDVRSLFQPAELTLEQARANGYKSATSLRTEQNAGNLSPEEQEAFSGSVESQGITADGVPGEVKEDSCVADAYKKLYGSVESGVLFEGGVQNLPLPYVNTAKSDAAMDDVDKKWSQCMQDEHQLSFPNPDNTNISEESGSLDVAVADASCREKVGYEKTVKETLNKYLTSFLNDKEAVVQQLTEAKKTAEQNAPALLNK